MVCLNSFLTKKQSTFFVSFFFVLILFAFACNRPMNENVESTQTDMSKPQKTDQNEHTTSPPDKTQTNQVAKQAKNNEYAYDKFYGEKHFTANYISEYGMKFRELTFLIDTNYLEACPGHYSQIAYYVTAPTPPTISYTRLSDEGKIWCIRDNEKSGTQTIGSYRFRAKIKEIGTHLMEIKASVGTEGEAGYMEKTHQITMEASCKTSCPPFTEKVIPTNTITWVLPYDVYVTSSENSIPTNNKKCKTSIDIQFKDTVNNAINYQIFKGVSPFIDNPTSKKVHQNPNPAFNGTGNGKQNGLCNGSYYIELSDPSNGCRTHKAFEVQQGELISEDQHIFKTDTVYEERNGRKYVKVLNPHPAIQYIEMGKNNYYKVMLRKNMPEINKMTEEGEIKYIKELINFNEELDSIGFDENLRSRVYHKGLRVRDFDFSKEYGYYRVKYKPIDVNVKDVITETKAVEIGKQKATDSGQVVADTTAMVKYLDRLKEINPNHPQFHKLDTGVKYQIMKFNDEFVPCYRFKIYNKSFIRNPVYIVNAYNGKIELEDYDGLYKCKICNDDVVEESDCSLTHPFNDELEVLPCEFPLEIHKFENYPDIFDGCSSIESCFDVCSNQINDVIILTDIKGKISAVNKTDNLPEFIFKGNTSYNDLEVQILTAFKNTEQVFHYYNSKIENLGTNIPNVTITASAYSMNNAEAIAEELRLLFGDGTDDNCLPNVSANTVSHEFFHLVLRRHYDIFADSSESMFEILNATALEEALCDIMAVLFNYSENNNYDWSLFDETCPDNKFFRLLNDPENSDPPQRVLFETDFDRFDEYYWADIISYWFYLLT